MAADGFAAVGSSKEGVCSRVALDLVGLCGKMAVSDSRLVVESRTNNESLPLIRTR